MTALRVLVTGADGFTGRHLVGYLRENTPHTIFCSTGNPGHPEMLCCDLRDAGAVRKLLEESRPDQIYNLAGSFTQNFENDFALNVQSVKNILEAVLQLKLETRVLLVGSAAEYGAIRPEDNPVTENQSLNPVSVYGLTKACQTHLMKYYCATHGMNLVMARTFNLLGKELSPSLFVGRLYEQIAAFKKGATDSIRLGNLKHSRDYVPVADAVRDYVRIMDFGEAGNIYHVASGKPVRMRDLLARILAEESVPLNAVRENAAVGSGKFDVPMIYADTSKIGLLRQKDMPPN